MTGTHREQGAVQHSAAKGGSLRRSWICAWIVTVAMGGTTMAFQVYHSLTTGHMPWPLAWLFGIMPLLIAMLILEIVAEWHDSPLMAKIVAYAVMIGAMYMSASGTGVVVRYAAPPHFALLFGALLDASELVAAYFIMSGPRAADATAAAAAAAMAERESQLRAAANAERFAREEAELALKAAAEAARQERDAALAELGRRMEAERSEWRAGARAADAAREEEVTALRRELADGQAAMSARLDAVSASRAAALSAQREKLLSEVEAERTARASAQRDLASAQQETAGALARAEALARKLAAVSDRTQRKAVTEGTRESAQATVGDGDLTTELSALMELRANPELRKPRKGGELARLVGVSGATARRYREKFLNPDGSLRELPAESLSGPLSERAG